MSIYLLERCYRYDIVDIFVIYFNYYLSILYLKFFIIKLIKNIKNFKIVVNNRLVCIEYIIFVNSLKYWKNVGG